MSASNVAGRMPEPAHGHTEAAPHHEIPYMRVFWALIVLTAITVLVAIYMRFSSELINVLVALLIAMVKGSLVALFFMHLKYEGKLIYLIFLVPLGLCVLLIFALIPDVVMNKADSTSSSLHSFNAPPAWANQPAGHE